MNESEPPTKGLRLMVYDRTCRGRLFHPGLSTAWWTGARLYRALGRLDAYHGVESWDEALEWLAEFGAGQALAEVQYWGHGTWGTARVCEQRLDRRALESRHPLHARLMAVRARLRSAPDSLWWFRTCETFGAQPGQRFATEFSECLGTRVAGHTFIIGHIQSGLHSLRPGQRPYWADTEGLREGSPEHPERAQWSRWSAPNTITCLRGDIPPDY